MAKAVRTMTATQTLGEHLTLNQLMAEVRKRLEGNAHGDIPTVSICTDDVICDSAAASGWIGYLTGAHGNYSFDVDDYSDDGNGQWFNGVFMPW